MVALADTQWNLGRLEDFVKEKALFHIRDGYDLSVWEKEDPKMAKVRATVLKDLEQKLLTPQPEEKKVSQYKLYHCEWKFGDVYAYQMKSDAAREHGLFGRYILINKTGEDIWWPGHTVPMVRIKFTKDDKLPSSEEEINEAEYIRVGSISWVQVGPLAHYFGQEYVDNRIKQYAEIRELYGDEEGKTYSYYFKLLSTSKRVIPKDLIFIGNFPNLPVPLHYFGRDMDGNYAPVPSSTGMSVYWKELEEVAIHNYLTYHC